MPSAHPLPDSGDALWREMLAGLREVLPEVLRNHLHFADPQKVAELALIHLGRCKLSKEELERSLAQMPADPKEYGAWRKEQAERLAGAAAHALYVQDADKVAEYRLAQTGVHSSASIREEFRQRTLATLRFHLEVLLEGRGVSNAGDAALDDFCKEIQEELFSESAFALVAFSYLPAKGMTFERYLLRKAFWLAQDHVKEFLDHTPATVPLNGVDSASDTAEKPGRNLSELLEDPMSVSPGEDTSFREETERRLSQAQARFKALLRWFGAKGVSPRKQALVFLYFKAYVEPEVIPANIPFGIVGGRVRLEREYHEACSRLEQLREGFLETSVALQDRSGLAQRKAEELTHLHGRRGKDLIMLENVARKSTVEELEDELAALDPEREAMWACEVEFMLAFKRRAAAQGRYEEMVGKLRRYTDYMKPWVRSQKELTNLIADYALKQGTVGRELAEILTLLPESGLDAGLFRGLAEEDEEET
jgi:hypothetical protein